MKIKICGVTEIEQAMTAAGAGADFIGFVFAESRRKITLNKANKIAKEIKKNFENIQLVGVFASMPVAIVNAIADYCDLDWVQLSGDESAEYCREIEKPIIKAIKVRKDIHRSSEILLGEISNMEKTYLAKSSLFLLDSYMDNRYGGTGKTFDWELAKPLVKQYPIIIAGGLNPDNVKRVVSEIRPWGVDVSSGVETAGVKDITKIKKFIENARQANGC